jgi:SET domain-containing protein
MSHPLVVVRRSPIQGRGVFARVDIPRGKRIIEYVGERITDAEATARYDDEKMARHHTFLFGVSDDLVIDANRVGNEARFINHSCDPNCESVIVGKRVYIYARRRIPAGAELLYDYWYTTDETCTMADLLRLYPCACGSPKCRGTLARPPRARTKKENKKKNTKKAG